MTKKYENRIKKAVFAFGLNNVKEGIARNKRSEMFQIRYATSTPLEMWDDDIVMKIIDSM